MPVKKTAKQAKLNFVTGRKKTMLISVFAFAVVGVAFLIRSFAATTVYSVNTVDVLNGANPAWTTKNATAVTEGEGKKATKLTEVTAGGSLNYKFNLAPGRYKACFMIKPMTTTGFGTIGFSNLGVSGGGYGGGFGLGQDSDLVQYSYKDICLFLNVQSATTNYSTGISIDSGTWRVTTFTIQLDETLEVGQTANIGLASALSGNDARFTFTNSKVVTDGNAQVVEVAPGGKIEYKSTALADGEYRFCYQLKMMATSNTGAFSLGRHQRGGSMSLNSTDYRGTLNTTAYNDVCSGDTYQSGTVNQTVTGVTPDDPLWLTFEATTGTWRASNLSLKKVK